MRDAPVQYRDRQRLRGRAHSDQQGQEVLRCRVGAIRMRCARQSLHELIAITTENGFTNPGHEFQGVCRLVRVARAELVQVVRKAA